MSGVRVELANPNTYANPREYIEKHLAPAVAELHRVTNELLSPGSTSTEETSVDMVPTAVSGDVFHNFDTPLTRSCKHVFFDGSEYESLPPEVLRKKQLKVLLSATVCVLGEGSAEFRLVNESNKAIHGSQFVMTGATPLEWSFTLPFGTVDGCIEPKKRLYFLQGRSATALPVCRRFSLSFFYV